MKKKELKLMLEFCWNDERGPIGDQYVAIENLSKKKLMEILGITGEPNVTPLGYELNINIFDNLVLLGSFKNNPEKVKFISDNFQELQVIVDEFEFLTDAQ